MNIQDFINKASSHRTVAGLMEMLEDYGFTFDYTEFCNEANIELMLSDVLEDYMVIVHLFPLGEMIDDEEAIDDFIDYCNNQDWEWIDDNIEGMYLIVSETEEPYRTICDYKNFGYTEEQAEALLLRAL